MRNPLDQLVNPGEGEPNAGGGYDRPSQPWVCGNAESGCPCPFGPTPQGSCPEMAECRPVQDGDRWRCNRPERRGGPCDGEDGCNGPKPDGSCSHVHHCLPVRSLRNKRRRLLIGSCLFIAGGLAMVLGSGNGPGLLVPGPLTHAHARLIKHEDSRGCANCHPGGTDTLVGHTTAALLGRGGISQSDLCLDCHERDIDRTHALHAHNMPASFLESLGSNDDKIRQVSHTGDGPPAEHDFQEDTDTETLADRVACAVCHQEHQGAMHNLAAISDHRCQSCHQRRYDHFATDHPELGDWPYRRRTRITFDHARHEELHFTKDKTEFACSRCHVEGVNGNMVTLGFDATCSKCHLETIQTTQAEGIPMVMLPTVDDVAFEKVGIQLGPWPENAKGDFDGELPIIMKMLLLADPTASEAMVDLDPAFSFFDLDPEEPEDVKSAAVLVRATRKLMSEIVKNGHEEIITRVGDKSLASGLPVDLVLRSGREWFGNLPSLAVPPRMEQVKQLTGGGWFGDPRSLSIRYAATGHSDDFIAAWLDKIVSLAEDQADFREIGLKELGTYGGCLMCHSIERQTTGKLAINWVPYDTITRRRPFTRFSHAPHVTQPVLADCRHCHQFTKASPEANPYVGHDPHVFVNHYQAIEKSACIECHRPKLVDNGCVQCHNYHVDMP